MPICQSPGPACPPAAGRLHAPQPGLARSFTPRSRTARPERTRLPRLPVQPSVLCVCVRFTNKASMSSVSVDVAHVSWGLGSDAEGRSWCCATPARSTGPGSPSTGSSGPALFHAGRWLPGSPPVWGPRAWPHTSQAIQFQGHSHATLAASF